MKNTSEKIDTKIPIDRFSDSRYLRGEQHDLWHYHDWNSLKNSAYSVLSAVINPFKLDF
nr:hypothetical protein GZ9E5_26 [uncultured archaeon GZfos9E5]